MLFHNFQRLRCQHLPGCGFGTAGHQVGHGGGVNVYLFVQGPAKVAITSFQGSVELDSARPTITAFPPTGAHGRQVPDPVVGACARADVYFLPTTWSMTHTDARIAAQENGARGCTMCEVTEDCLAAGGILADFEQADVLRASVAAGVHGLISQLPDGYDTHVEFDTGPLSGGERQRIAFARALFREPRVLILDEPNASLDKEGERALISSLNHLKSNGVTIVMVAHRAGILSLVDRIVLLDAGRVRDAGPSGNLQFQR